MKLKQKHIGNILHIPDPLVSMIMTGKREISWPLAAKLAKIFSYRTTEEWKAATPEQFRKAFESDSFQDLIHNFETINFKKGA